MAVRRRFPIVLILCGVFVALLLTASANATPEHSPLYQATPSTPSIISYQGRVLVNGARFNGAGLFKFAVVNSAGDAAYWSNDGTGLGAAPFQPTGHITLTVSNGVFGVALGDTSIAGMTQPITAGIATSPDRSLRVWFNDGALGWQQLAPDVALASVPYAFVADSAVSATTATTATFASSASMAISATTASTATSSHNADLLGGLAASSSPTGSAIVSTDVSGTVALSRIYGGTAANDDLTLEGTSHVTKTTSYVILQPTDGKVGIGITPTEKFEINLGNLRFNIITAPSSSPWPPTTILGTGLSTGWYYYIVTFVSSTGETDPSDSTGINITSTTYGTAHLTAIPTGSSSVIQRKIYRMNPASTGFHYLATINDNVTTVYTDTIPDATVEASPSVSAKNSTGGTIYFNSNPVLVLVPQNTSIGYRAGGNQTSLFGVHIGYMAGNALTYGMLNTNIGYKAGQATTTANENVNIGYQAGLYTTLGGYNTFVGGDAGRSNTIGTNNVFIGSLAGLQSRTGSYNVFIGGNSGVGASTYTTATNNVAIGYYAGRSIANSSTGNVFLGYQAGYNETGSNKLYIANSSTTSPLILGDFSAATLNLNGAISVAGNIVPTTNTFNLGNSSLWWNEIHYKTLTSHSLGTFENGVKLRDGRTVTCLEALAELKPDPEMKLKNGQPHIDYSTLPNAAYRPAEDSLIIHTLTTTNKTGIINAIPISDTTNLGTYYVYTVTETLKGEPGADLDAMVSLVLCAANEVNARSATLEARIAALEKALGVKP